MASVNQALYSAHLGKSRVRWGNGSHRDGVVFAVVIIGDIPLQGIGAFLSLVLLCIEQRSIIALIRLHQQEMSVPDKLGSDLVRRCVGGEADLVVSGVGAWNEQLLVRE